MLSDLTQHLAGICIYQPLFISKHGAKTKQEVKAVTQENGLKVKNPKIKKSFFCVALGTMFNIL